MKLEWNYKEAQYGRYWLELSNDGSSITKILLVDCKHDGSGYNGVIRYKYSGVTILDDITLDEAMKQVEEYMVSWWEKRYKAAERDYLEAMEIIEFLKTFKERNL